MKKFLVTAISMVIISLTIGMTTKSSYTRIDVSGTSEDLDQYIVTSSLVSAAFENTVIYDDEGNESIMPPVIENSLLRIESAEYVVLGEATGRIDNLFGTLQQEVEIIEVYKGNKDELEDNIKITSLGVSFKVNWEAYWGTVVNTMKKGQRYLIFFNKDYRMDDLYTVASISLPYFNIEDQENYIPNEEDQKEAEQQTINKAFVDGIIYGKVKDNEFFVKDEVALEKIINIKSDILNQYLGQ